jgi:hypothetical protein
LRLGLGCRSPSGTYAARIERLTPEELILLRKAVAKHQPHLCRS